MFTLPSLKYAWISLNCRLLILLLEYKSIHNGNSKWWWTVSGSGKFKYGPGTQQNYKYSVNVRSFFNGTSKNESTLYVEGKVDLDFLTPCDGLLTLSEFNLSEDGLENPNSYEFNEMLSEHTLRFSFNDGVISEICPPEDENNWVLNFKRGILSMFHNSMKRFDLDISTTEKDVRGQCPTKYTVRGAKETSLLIQKTKDLNACQNRAQLHSVVQSVPYHFRPVSINFFILLM